MNRSLFSHEGLSAELLTSAIRATSGVLRELLGDSIVKAVYGFGCDIHPDLQYIPMSVGTRWIERFVEDSLRQAIVKPGEGDFWFEVPDGRLVVWFGHEGDIQLGGSDEALLARVGAMEPFSGIQFNARPAAKAPIRATGDPGDAERLLGRWVLVRAEGDIDTGDVVSATFSSDGTLLYTIREGEKLEIMALTYQVREGSLITDQPSKPKLETTAFWFDDDGRLVLQGDASTAWFNRVEETSAA